MGKVLAQLLTSAGQELANGKREKPPFLCLEN